MGKRRKFSGESKREAVQMTMVPETTIRQVAKDPGISERLLGRWKRDLETHGGKTFVGQGHARDEELMRLRRARQGEAGAGFLAEAAAFFAKHSAAMSSLHRYFLSIPWFVVLLWFEADDGRLTLLQA